MHVNMRFRTKFIVYREHSYKNTDRLRFHFYFYETQVIDDVINLVKVLVCG